MPNITRTVISGFAIAAILSFTLVPGLFQKAAAQPRFDKPYADSAANRAYNQFFCDDPELFRPKGNEPYAYPFNILYSEESNSEDFQKIIDDPKCESRWKILAYRKANLKGIKIYHRDLLSVIIEVGQKDGLDALAIFKDGTARYIDPSGKVHTRDLATDKKATELAQDLFASFQTNLNNASPWDGPRWAHPMEGMSRISMLASDRFFFSESPTDEILNNRNLGPVLINAMNLMRILSEKPKSNSSGKRK